MRKLKLFFVCLLMAVLSIGQMWATDTEIVSTFAKVKNESPTATFTASATGSNSVYATGTTFTITSKEGNSWTLTPSTTGSIYFSMNNSEGGFHLGSGSYDAGNSTLASSISYSNVTQVAVRGKTGKNGSVTVSVKVGNTSMSLQSGSNATISGSTAATATFTSSSSLSGNIYVSLTDGATNIAYFIESVTITTTSGGSSNPTVTVDPASWNFGDVEQSANASKEISVSGSNLQTGNLTLTAPSGYSVDPTSISVTSATLSATSVTISKNKNTTGANNGNLSISGCGLASAKTIALSMNIVADPVLATLPFAFDGGKADIANKDGMSQEGLDSDYGSSPKLKFNSTGDYVLIHFNGEPYKLTYDILGNSFSSSTFKVQTSANGTDYIDLATYTSLGSTKTSEEKSLGSTVRYVKFIYTSKSSGNVALGNIGISAAPTECADPVFSPDGGAVESSTEVSITTTTNGASIYYTIGDSPADPTAESTLYNPENKPVVSASTTIKAIAIKAGLNNSSVVSKSFTVAAALTDEEFSWSAASYGATLGEENTYPSLTNTHTLDVTYQSTEETVATIASNGTITLNKAGSTTIKAIFAGTDNYAAKTVTYTLTVAKGADSNTSKTLDLSIDETDEASDSKLQWNGTYVTVAVNQANASTATNNYYPGTSGQSYTSTRFYANSTLTFTPDEGYKIDNIVFTATTDGYATALGNSTWTNAVAAVGTGDNSKIITVTPSGSGVVSATIGATCGFTQIVMTYHQQVSSAVTISAPQHGTITVMNGGTSVNSGTSVVDGTELTVSGQSNNAAYRFGTISAYKTDDQSTTVTITDGKIRMPLYPITITANEIALYTLAVAVNDGDMGSATINGGAGPVYVDDDDEITLVATANPGYEFVEWTVSDDDIILDDENAASTTALAGASGTITATFQQQACTGLAAPTLDEITTTYQSATIAWNAVNNAEGYVLNLKKHEGNVAVVTDELIVAPSVSFEKTGLAAKTQYDYSIMAVGDGSTYCDESNPLLEGNFTTNDYPTVKIYYSENEVLRVAAGTGQQILTDFTLPTTVNTVCTQKELVGWTTAANAEYSHETVAPDPLYAAGATYQIPTNANCTLYAVYANVKPETTTWDATAIGSLGAGDVFVIVGDNGSKYAMTNDNGTNAPSATSVTVNNSKITSTVAANMQWNISGNSTDGYVFYPNGSTTTWLYCTNTNNGVKVGTGEAKHFTINQGYLYETETTDNRFVGIFSSQDWRCYTGNDGNIANQTFTFYKKNETPASITNYATQCQQQVATPVISGVTDGETYEENKTVTITCGTSDATIYYSIDGQDPATAYTKPFTLSDNDEYTIRAYATKSGMIESDEATSVTVTIDKPYTTIASFIAAEPTNKKLIFTGAKVLGVTANFIYIQDATAGIQLFKSNHGLTFASGKTLSGHVIGTYSNNSSSAYMPRLTFTDGSTMSVTEDEPALPDATVITAGSAANLCKLVKLEDVKFQSTSLSSNAVCVQKSDLDIDTVYNTFGVLNQTLPNSATSCDVTGVLIKYSSKYEIAPVSVDGITTNGALAILPTLSTTGGADEEHAVAVAVGKVITITPAAGMTSTYKDGTADAADLTSATEVTIGADKAIVVTANAYYYTENTATYYYHADQSLTEHTISKAAMTNGEVTVKIGEDEVSSAAQNATIRLLVAPSANYHMTEISVTDAEDGNVALTEVTAGEEYTFTMPAKAVTVSATFEEDAYAIVTFVKGNESADGIAPSSFKKYVGQIATMPGKNTLAYVGYDFAGWTYGGNDYAENDIYTIQAEDAAIGGKTINFEAKWIAWPDEASIYTSNIIKQGVNTPDAKVVLEDEEEYDAWKIAKGSSITLTIPAGTTTIYGHLVAWKGESANVTISGSCFSSNIVLTPAADDGISNNSPFTLVANGSTFYFKLTPDEAITQDVNITFTATSNKRAVVYGVNAIFPQITLSPASYDFENVRANQTKQQVFTITQNENVTGTLSASITNDATGKYSVSDIEDNKVTVTFNPNGASSGTFTAKLRIAASNATVTADLTGTAIGAEAPEIVVNKNAVAFGQVDPNASVSEAIAVQLLHIDGAVSAALSGDDAGKFTLSATSFTEDGVLTITPTTSAQGIFSATLTLSAKDVENIDIPISITVASKWAVTYTSNIALTTEGGTNASTAKVVINSTQYDAIKAGTGSGAGAVRITVPKHTKFLHIHAAAWTGESPTLTITGASTTPSALTLTADEGVSNNSPFTLQNSPIGQIFDVAIPDSETPTTITLTADGGNNKKRFVIYGVNQEGGVIEITESTNISTLGDVENQPIVASGEGVVLTVNVPTTAGSIAATNGATIKITEATTASDVVVDENSKIELTATVTAPVFRICTAPGQQATSGQVTGVSHVAAESIIMDVQLLEAGYMDADYWYSISAPFDVNVAGGFMTTGGRVLIHNVDFQIWSYAPDLYANGGRSWRRCADGVMHKNAAYLIGFDPVRFDNGIVPNVVRLKAAENTTLDDEVNTINDLQTQTSATLKPGYAWNGVANPNVYHINVGRDVQLWDNYSHGFLPATVGNNGLLDHDSYSFVVGTPFFCKDDGTHRIAITAATHVTEYTIPNEAPARNAAERYSFCVQIRKPGSRYYENRLYVRASEDALATFEDGKDMETLNETCNGHALIWTNAYGKRLAIEDAPLTNNQAMYDLTIMTPAAGTYVLRQANEVDGADLYVTYGGQIVWNLSLGDYELDLTRGTTTGYGLLLVVQPNQMPTGVENGELLNGENGVQKILLNGNLYILRDGHLYDAVGKQAR